MTIPDHPQFVRRVTRIPPIYRPPFGGPLRWQDDQSGVLPAAINAYIDHRIGERIDPPAAAQLELVVDYLIHYICAPCWNHNAQRSLAAGDDWMPSKLIQLRLDLVENRVRTSDDIAAWIARALEIGIDPL